jgi:hypothetical protein
VTDGFLTLSRWAQCTCTEGNYGALGCMRFEPVPLGARRARAAVAQGQKSKSPELSEGPPQINALWGGLQKTHQPGPARRGKEKARKGASGP